MLINSVMEAVGSTPLIRLSKMSSGNVFVKAEFLNPGGSIKDRVARHIARFTRHERSEWSVCNRLLGRTQRGPIAHQ
jgi:cysteine synthase A